MLQRLPSASSFTHKTSTNVTGWHKQTFLHSENETCIYYCDFKQCMTCISKQNCKFGTMIPVVFHTSGIISQCLVSSCIILDFQTENTIREFDTWDGHHCRTPWCCKLHASHRSQRKHPQRYNEPNSLVTSTTSCTNLLHTRTIQCKECVLRSLRPRLLRLTSKHHCRIDMQTEQWSSLWTYQFPHRLPHQTNQAPHVLARIH